jgi:hypothetical protein
MAVVNMDGTLYIVNFDLKESSKQGSLFDTQFFAKTKEFKINDFQFIDSDTLLACCSLKEKSI